MKSKSKVMIKTARILFVIFGIVMPILIGSLHTYVHFTELLTPEVFEHLKPTILINGKQTPLWNTWGLVSFMMGTSFIIIGLLNWAAFRQITKQAAPPLTNSIIMILYLLCVIYAGHTFNAPEQFYGSIVGLILMSVSIFLSLKSKSNA